MVSVCWVLAVAASAVAVVVVAIFGYAGSSLIVVVAVGNVGVVVVVVLVVEVDGSSGLLARLPLTRGTMGLSCCSRCFVAQPCHEKKIAGHLKHVGAVAETHE